MTAMDYRPLGTTGLQVSRIALGCGNFGGIGSAPEFYGQGETDEEAFAIMDAALEAGINVFDTANAYGGGRSETAIGKWLAKRGSAVRDQVLLSTKAFNPVGDGPNDRGLSRRALFRAVDSSLGRFGAERIDLFLCHEPDPGTPLEETLGALDDLRRAGKLHYIGASNIEAWRLARGLWISDVRGLARFEWVQSGYSLLDRSPEAEVLPLCAEMGLGFSPFSPLSGGWLTGKYRREQAPPAGSRMTLRSEPYEHLQRPAVFDALEAPGGEGERARRRDADTGSGLAARGSADQPRRRRPAHAGAPRAGARRPRAAPRRRGARRALRALPAEPGSCLMSVRVLSGDDVRAALTMKDCIEAMDAVLRQFAAGELYLPLRSVVRPPQSPAGFMGLMTAHRAGETPAFGLKAVAIFPENPRRGLDAHQGVVVVFSGEDGRVTGVVDASAVTAIRTAAVSAVATRALAREGATTLAVLGAGVQAAAHIEAMACVMPLERVRIYSRRSEPAGRLADSTADRYGVDASASATVEEALHEADVIVTATTAREPIVERGWFAPGAHINAVGSSIPTTRELDGATVGAGAPLRRRARVDAQRVGRPPARRA